MGVERAIPSAGQGGRDAALRLSRPQYSFDCLSCIPGPGTPL